MLSEGQKIDRFRVVRLLGSGAMGDVYLAEDSRIEQKVAIKVIRSEVSSYPDSSTSQEATRLFQREAKAIARLDHPHILPLLDYGEELIANMTVVYLVMPYRREGSLADWLGHRGQAGLLSLPQVAHFVRQAASALQHAHNHQVIHQDVKPSNFLLRALDEQPLYPDLLLADFGIARLATATTGASQAIRGTPIAMAPEQWEGHAVPATDQYALAVMAYELLTGRPPFLGPLMSLINQHLKAQPPLPSTLNPRLSSDVDNVLLHALAKQPEQRFKSISAFANAFQQAVRTAPKADAPTLRAATPSASDSGDIRAVLAISTAEAQSGTNRTVTLPGGRQVRVPVPAGVQDGYVVRLDGQGEPIGTDGAAGALILTIMVKAADEADGAVPLKVDTVQPTLHTANTAEAEPAPTSSSTNSQLTANSAAPQEVSTPPSPPTKPPELSQTPQPLSSTEISAQPVPTPTPQKVTSSSHSPEQTSSEPVVGQGPDEEHAYQPIAGSVVDYDQNQLVQGKALTIFYKGFLRSSSRVYLHWGKNGWQNVSPVDEPMIKRTSGLWQARIYIPIDATQINLAFHDESGRWDNNGGKNWNLAIRAAKSNLKEETPSGTPLREQEKATPQPASTSSAPEQVTSLTAHKRQRMKPILLSISLLILNAIILRWILAWILKTASGITPGDTFMLGTVSSIFIGIIMGIIAVLLLKKESEDFLKGFCLISGLVALIADVIILLAIGSTLNIGAAFALGIFTPTAWFTPAHIYWVARTGKNG